MKGSLFYIKPRHDTIFSLFKNNRAIRNMDRIWTPENRDEFIHAAMSSKHMRGNRGPYHFNVMPKIVGHDNENTKRTSVTSKLMNTILSNPEYRILALKFYAELRMKIVNNVCTRDALEDIAVVLKGGTAYTYMAHNAPLDAFPFSDLDIVIYINPHLPPNRFNMLKSALNTIVLQTVSQYKRTIDHMLFLDKPINTAFMTRNSAMRFKKDLGAALADLDDEEGIFLSPFEDDTTRNSISRHSFIIADSMSNEDSVVRVEVPHFEMCEHIPLRRTPLFCSHNRSINFKRAADVDGSDMIGCFDLYRLRFNTMFLKNNVTDADQRDYNVVTADFIDVSILAQNDAELVDFWRHGVLARVLDHYTHIWVDIPNIDGMIYDLYKMLNVYDCPESKREKRQVRYDMLTKVKLNTPRTGAGKAAGYNCV